MKKHIGYEWESCALLYYQNQGYNCIDRNFTIRGWELDLILMKEKTIIFVEVKVTNTMSDLCGYITAKKLSILKRTIRYFLLQAGNKYKEFDIRLDVVFVTWWKIWNVYHNVRL